MNTRGSGVAGKSTETDRVIPADQHEKIAEAFDHIEHEETGEGIQEKYLGIAEEQEKAVTA